MHTHQKGKKKSAFSFNGKRKTDDWIQSGEQDMRRQSWVFVVFSLQTYKIKNGFGRSWIDKSGPLVKE